MKKRTTPFQQMLPLLSERERVIVSDILINLSVSVAEDFCLAVIAFLRFRQRRKFQSIFLQATFDSLIEFLCMTHNINPNC